MSNRMPFSSLWARSKDRSPNLLIFHNSPGIEGVVQPNACELTPELLGALSAYRTHPINRFGMYELRKGTGTGRLRRDVRDRTAKWMFSKVTIVSLDILLLIYERILTPTLPQARVLLGIRRSPEGATIPAGEPRHERLQALFGAADALILDLEDEPETSIDIAQYVCLRLRDSRHRNDPEGIERVARPSPRKRPGSSSTPASPVARLQDTEGLDIDFCRPMSLGSL